MHVLLWKVRLSVLWVVLAVGMSAHMIMALFEPGIVEGLMEGQVEGEDVTTGLLVMIALFWIVPLAMAFLCFVFSDPANRFANAGVGLVVTGMWAWDLVESVGDGFSGITLVLAGIVAAGLAILWHAWRWPKAQDKTQRTDDVTLTAASTP